MPYFLSQTNLNLNKLEEVSGDEARHILLAHRAKKGERIKIQGPDGKRFLAEIMEINKKTLTLKIEKEIAVPPKPSRLVTLFQAVVSEKALDFIFQKGTELGVEKIVLFNSSKVGAKLNMAQFKKKQERWLKILTESTKQCERVNPPMLEFILSLEEVFNQLKDFDQIFLADVSGFKLSTLKPLPSSLAVVVGPEGGFSEEEFAMLKKQQSLTAVSLGPNILRAETAALAMVSVILNK